MTEESGADASEPPDGAAETEDASRGHQTESDDAGAPTKTAAERETDDAPESGGATDRAPASAASETDPPAASEEEEQEEQEHEGDPTGKTPPDPAELTVEERSLHPRIRTIWLVRTTILALILGGIAAFVDAAELGIGPVVPVAVTTVALVVLLPIPILRYRAWRYEIREDAIYLERGVFTRVRTVVPYIRIQHVDTARGPIARATGLARLVVYTAGSRGADVTIPGLALEDARDHQRRLKQLAIAAEDDTAV